MEQVSISDVQRNLHRMEEWEVVEIVDKKRNRVKGYFLGEEYADAVHEMLRRRQELPERAKRLRGVLGKYIQGPKDGEEKNAWRKAAVEQYRP